MKTRYFIQLSYKGTNYCGWQVQNNQATVQGVLNHAFNTYFKKKIPITGAGRTDTGVHAKFFIAHFDSDCSTLDKDQRFIHHINGILPEDIAVHKVMRVQPDAHSRFSAVSRTYEYRIARTKDPFLREYSWFLSLPLNIKKMNKAAALLFEYTDFSSFCKSHAGTKTNLCCVTHAAWKEKNGQYIFTVSADRFLRNMVRAIVGSLILVGQDKKDSEDFRLIIEGKQRSLAGTSVPAQGLFLVNIEYPEVIWE